MGLIAIDVTPLGCCSGKTDNISPSIVHSAIALSLLPLNRLLPLGWKTKQVTPSK
ncbi:MAG: hypothetical protein QNJ32_11870 [Xenococcaceae cyanobacterium MO_167.B27]|nr:hypothetical protein [Xenococcaceae cyanobacterium MO_167.B27]